MSPSPTPQSPIRHLPPKSDKINLAKLQGRGMHELSVTQSVLDIAVEKAKAAGAGKITRINLVIGEISSLIDNCVQFYFDFLSKDTIASGATLSFDRVPLKVRCKRCGAEFSPAPGEWKCPACGEWDVELKAGNEFYLDSIEVE